MAEIHPFDFDRLTGKVYECAKRNGVFDRIPHYSQRPFGYDFKNLTGKIRECMMNNDLMDAGGRLTYKNYKGHLNYWEGEYTPIDHKTCWNIDEGDLCCLRVQYTAKERRLTFIVIEREDDKDGQASRLIVANVDGVEDELVCHPTELIVLQKG